MADKFSTKPGRELVPAHRRNVPSTLSRVDPLTGRPRLPGELPLSTAMPVDPMSAAFGYPVPTLPAEGITTTPSFQTWSEKIDSRLRDEEGNIKKAYHGTIFDVEKLSAEGAPLAPLEHPDERVSTQSERATDPFSFVGTHWSEAPEVGSEFAEGLYKVFRTSEEDLAGKKPEVSGGRVIPAYLQITNPFIAPEKEIYGFMVEGRYDHELVVQEIVHSVVPGSHQRRLASSFINVMMSPDTIKKSLWTEDFNPQTVSESVSTYQSSPEFRKQINLLALEQAAGFGPNQSRGAEPDLSLAHEMGSRLRNQLIEKGFDGVIYPNTGEGGGDSYIAFKSDQIRSAISPEEEYKHGGFIEKPLYDRAR